MQKTTNKKYGILSFLILNFSFLILLSCTAPIDIDTDNSEPVIVIYSTLTDELRQQEVRISRSSPYLDNQPNATISGALVTITSSDLQTYHLTENPETPGLYQSTETWSVKENVAYSLDVEVDFNSDGIKESYKATTGNVIPLMQLDSIKIVPLDIMGHTNYAMNIYGLDSPEHDYYICKFLVNDSLITTQISKIFTVDDVVFNNTYVDGITLRYFDDIEEYEKDSEERRKNSTYLQSGDVVELQMSRVPKGYHDFINQCQKEMRGENPFFGGPASNITTNISNGGVGYFSGYVIARAKTTVP